MTVTKSVKVHGVAPHMHALASSMRVNVTGDADTACMIDVPDWDFHWQQLYFYEEPLHLQGGDEVRVTCTYDTRGQTETTLSGEGTDDEMCIAFFYVTAG